MKDFLGQVVKVGDYVVYEDSGFFQRGWIKEIDEFDRSVVIGFKPGAINYEWDNLYVTSKKLIKVSSRFGQPIDFD